MEQVAFPLNFCPKKMEDAKQKVTNTRYKISSTFKKKKAEIHQKEDPEFLQGNFKLSKVFDLRWWDIVNFRDGLKF